MPKEYVSEADRLRAFALQERAAVRKMRAKARSTSTFHVLRPIERMNRNVTLRNELL